MRLFDLTPLGLLRVSGEAAKKFLQGQLTCNLDEITAHQSSLGAHCNPQGRIISLFHLFLYREEYYLQMPRELVPIALKALQKYAVFFKVTLTDASDTLQQIGYVGEASSNWPNIAYEQISAADHMIIHLPDRQARYLIATDLGVALNFTVETAGRAHEFAPTTEWFARNMLQGIAAIYPETSGKFLPHELNLPLLGAVSFSKGCYTGQEIIARMQYRAKLKNHLYPATTETPLALTRGDDIYHQGQSKGSIVDYCQIAYNTYQLLVIANENDVQTGQLSVDAEEKYPLAF